MPVCTDTFSGGSFGTTDDGKVWQQATGVFGVAAGRARCVSGPNPSVALLGLGSEIDFSISMPVLEDANGIIFRARDSANYWQVIVVIGFGTYNLQKVTAGVPAFVMNSGLGTAASGDTVRVVCVGPSISIFVNGILKMSTVDATFQTGIGVGLYAANVGGVGRWDNLSVTYSVGTAGTGNPYTSDDILGGRVRARKESYLFDLLDINGAFLSTVSPGRDAPATIDNDTTRTNLRTLTGLSIDARRQAALNTLVARIRPRMVLQNGQSYNLGVFLFGDASRPRRSWGLELGATLVDQTFVLSQQVGRVVSYPVGTNRVAAALALAQEVISGPVSVMASASTTVSPKAYQPTQTRQEIINDLLASAAYLPVYFDNNGTMIMRPIPAIPATIPDFGYERGLMVGSSPIIKDSMLESDDLLTAPNRWVVVDTSATDTPIVGSYDLPASAPNSIVERGFAVTETIQSQGIGSVAAANAAAFAASVAAGNGFALAEFASLHDPRHDTFNVVRYLGNQHLELGWSIDLRSGAPMKHRLRRAYS